MPTGRSETSTGNSMAVEVPTVAVGRLPMGAELARRAQGSRTPAPHSCEHGEFSLKLPVPRTVGPVPGLRRKRSGPLPSSSERPFGKFKWAFLETCRKLNLAHLAKACKRFFKVADVGAGDIHQWALAVSREADQVVEGEEVVWPEPGWLTEMVSDQHNDNTLPALPAQSLSRRPCCRSNGHCLVMLVGYPQLYCFGLTLSSAPCHAAV
ncbi:hypothetical protein NUU61_006126 [Penicillium alfredii]|uniref:Uncharacterized protein n=1 Tax=Penicillium alfredii TaxID=1506179 RepID=A0A9W9F0F6_9EURO|nr:uncharacterized protein NUU61_006126 [Penicillium alfredii]KAJ5091256.1 hypothetical protein NUU61_006126 [Penicillium alfredii]